MRSPPDAAPLLAVEALESAYGRVRALKGVSLEVREGEVVCLLGANGAGKTTLLRAISGVQPVAAGRVRFEGANLAGAPAHRRVGLGIAQVPEGRQVFGPLTVDEHLRLGAYLRRDREGIERDRSRVFALFPVLAERRRSAGGGLSGGQQQMLAIGRALMSRPRLLLLDEPSMGLAPVVVDAIFEVIRGLAAEGVTVLLAEQNAAAALEVADRGVVLETGRVAHGGAARDLLADERVREAYLGL